MPSAWLETNAIPVYFINVPQTKLPVSSTGHTGLLRKLWHLAYATTCIGKGIVRILSRAWRAYIDMGQVRFLVADAFTSLVIDHVQEGMSDSLNTLERTFEAKRIHIQCGDVALEGKEEYIPSHLFDAADYDRWITCRGTLIRVYDPKAAKNTPAYWEHQNTSEVAKSRVPAGFKVEVIVENVPHLKSHFSADLARTRRCLKSSCRPSFALLIIGRPSSFSMKPTCLCSHALSSTHITLSCRFSCGHLSTIEGS